MAVAAVVNKHRAVGAVIRGKAQLIGRCIVKSRVDLPGQAVHLHHNGRVEKRLIVDVGVQQAAHHLAGVAVGVRLIIVQRVDLAVEGIGFFRGSVTELFAQSISAEVVAQRADFAQLRQKCIHIAAGILAGQGDLGGLEHGAGAGFVMFKPGQADIGDQPGARQGSQDAKNEQHDHQLHHREAPGGAQFLFDFLYNRQHKCTSFISGRSTKIDRFSNISRFIIV